MDSSIRTTTHDTSSAGFHMADFSSFLTHLTDAVSAAWPDKFTTRYRKVKVLLMSWEKDDLDVEAEIKPLESVLRGLYHYDTECWRIPSKRSAVELSRKIANLVDANGQEGNLLILYYAGHARPNDRTGGSPVWVANRSRDSPTVQSSIMHSLLGEVDCDVLLLHDCSHVIPASEVFSGKGMVETLAASGFESNDTTTRRNSFTASLIQELAHAAHTTDWLSVVELHRRLLNRLQAWMPSISFTDDSYSLVQVDRHTGQPMFETPRRRTPLYSFRSKKPRTIVLTPLPPQSRNLLEDSAVSLNTPTTQPQSIPDGPGILVTCRLRDQHVDAERWKQWLLHVPEKARSIQISAIYPGMSAILILELPLVVWDLLLPSPAISFVAYTTGQNHILDFRRALGLEPDDSSVTSEDESDDDEDARSMTIGKTTCRAKGRKSKTAGRTDRSPSLWPEMFDSDRTDVYAMEGKSYCWNLAEMQDDDTVNMAQKVIRAFVRDVGNPAMRYLCDEIQEFCATANFDALTGPEAAPKLVAMLDERSPPGSGYSRVNGMQFLSHAQLYEALSQPKPQPLLIDTESKTDYSSPRRRLIYVTNLDSASALALVSTASERQALFLREFVYKHITFQPGMDVKLQGSFQLSFHLPFLAWRQSSKASHDTRLGSDRQPLRNSRNVSFLGKPGKTYIHEAQISCMIVGVDNRHWTAYSFSDTYHDGGESRHDVRSYQPTDGESILDPLTGGRDPTDLPVWDAREYFLHVMECCVDEVRAEWQNVGRQLLKNLKPFTRNNGDISWGRAQRASHESIQILEQLTESLSGTLSAWETFHETGLPYFNLSNDVSATILKNLDASMQELRVLHTTLTHQTESLKSLTTRLLTTTTTTTTKRTTALLTLTALAFLPFTLTAVLSHTPPSLMLATPTPARYILASAVIACLAAGVYLVMTRWGEGVEILGEGVGRLINTDKRRVNGNGARVVLEGVKGKVGGWWFGEEGKDGGKKGKGEGKAGRGYKRLGEGEDSEGERGERGMQALPF